MANFQTNTKNTYYAVLSVTEQSQSANLNSTTLAYSLTLYSGDSYFSGYTIGYRVMIDGVQVAYHDNSGNQTSMSANSSKLVVSGTTTVTHNDDGSKTVAVSAEIWTDSGAYLPVSLSCSGNMVLSTILRESTITATDANIGATSMIAVNRKSSGYTHSIRYSFGTLSGYIRADGSISETEVKLTDTYIGFPVPEDFYAQIPDAKSGICTLTCKTYSGETQIGNAKTGTFTCIASETACSPNVTGTVIDTNDATKALTGSTGKFVKFFSNALCTISATANNSATITQKRIASETIDSGDTKEITGIEVNSVIFDATDSRGYTTSSKVEIDLVPYIKLTCRATAARLDSTSGNVKLTVSGNYYNGSFGAEDNALTLKYKVAYGDEVSITPEIFENTFTAEVVIPGLAYNQSYTITVSASDKLATASQSLPIKKGIPVFNWGEDDFEFCVPAVRPCTSVSLTGGTNGAGQAGYVRVANIRITGGYADAPIVMDITRRSDGEIYRLKLLYESIEGTDPSLLTFTATGGIAAFAKRTSAGKWDVYVQKAADNDSIAVLALQYNLLHMRDSLIIDCNLDGYLDSKPYSAIEAASGGDYIVDAGTTAKTGITWTWRKYASGVAMCWGICDEVTANVTTAWGTGVYVPGSNGNAGPFDLPFDFTESRCWPTPVQSNGDFWVSTWWPPDPTKQTPGYQPVRGTSKTGLNYRLALLVIGHWKAA